MSAVAFVSGAASGIGRAAALAFAKAGCAVVAADINGQGARETCKIISDAGGKASSLEVDVGNEASVQAAMNHIATTYHRLDYAINNAGIEGDLKPLHELSTSAFDDLMRTNLRGVFLAMKYQIPLMLDTKGDPSIIVTSSVAGKIGIPSYSLYCASKHGVLGLVKTAAKEYGGKIRVNALLPGMILTPMQLRAAEKTPPAVRAAMPPPEMMVPAKRIGQPEEIADTMVWMSLHAKYMTGETVVVDGGMTC